MRPIREGDEVLIVVDADRRTVCISWRGQMQRSGRRDAPHEHVVCTMPRRSGGGAGGGGGEEGGDGEADDDDGLALAVSLKFAQDSVEVELVEG